MVIVDVAGALLYFFFLNLQYLGIKLCRYSCPATITSAYAPPMVL